ncbi:uncharacterized protein H6S33_005570 [Morchella sextelata]|uniref:uncharacterized protein n=1 Tax=Morchella sextelata TaxID=1174677 RepID=UPI001D0525D2|nr:uncharacterized protein H6S33_005570 [Morchella sextelata]KAH0613684.1 hypothetical protein H6S33_005570 [Morchella sextelata]
MSPVTFVPIVLLAFLPIVASDSGDDFTNNLFSDLGPLLALFGERSAQQFMSQAMGVVDCIIFAMAPLGLITAAVGVIRIGGAGWLKACIGRAREAYAVPELELLSSTSSEVCELWNGLTLPRGLSEESQKKLWSVAWFGTALQLAVLVFDASITYNPTLKGRFEKNGLPVVKYAFPLTAIGTVLVVLGMFVSAYVIEDATKEEELEHLRNGRGVEMRVMWLQKYENVGDQNFESYAIFAREKRTSIRTSRRREPLFMRSKTGDFLTRLTTFATIVTLVGFVAQFLGLRAMSWTATIAQLIATVIMTGLRSWLTTAGLSQEPDTCKLPKEYELDWLATRMGDLRDDGLYENLSEKTMDVGFWSPYSWKWRVVTERHRTAESWSKLPSGGRANQVVEARKRLQDLTGWTREGSMAIATATAIEEFMNNIFSSDYATLEAGFTERLKFEWPVFIEFGGVQETYYLRLSRDSTKNKWKADTNSIEAILSLWTYSLQEKEEEGKKENTKDLCPRGGLTEKESLEEMEEADKQEESAGELGNKLRFLGPGDIVSQMCYRLWIYRGTDFRIFRRRNANTKYQTTGFPINPSLSIKRKATDKELDETLSVLTSLSVEAVCAQDMFSNFMWYIADHIRAVTPKTTLAKNSVGLNQETWQPPSLRNPFLENILRSVEATGLGTTEEMCMCIIPPLHSSGILHDMDLSSQELMSYVDERSDVFESQEDWEEAGKAYEWLYDTCLGYVDTEPSAFCRAAILLAHFSASINDAAGSCESYNMCPEVRHQKEINLLMISSQALKKLRSGPRGQEIYRVLKDAYQAAGDIQRLPEITDDLDTKGSISLNTPVVFGDSTTHEQPLEDIVRDLLFIGPNGQNFLCWTELHLAATGTSQYDLRSLSSTEASKLNARDRDGRTPLHWAVLKGKVETVEALLEAGCDGNIKDKMETTPLHIAVMEGKKDVVMCLLTKITNLETRNSKGWTSLHLAASAGFKDIIELLLKSGAKIEARDSKQRTPLHLAALVGRGHIITTLLNHNADSAAGDLNGSTALHLAAEGGFEFEVVTLLDKNANIEAQDVMKRTPLHVAVIARRAFIIDILLKGGANIESKDIQEATALHLAAQQGFKKEVEVLIDKGANIEAKDIAGETPLVRAFAGKKKDVIRVLLRGGANVNATSAEGDSVLQVAAYAGNLEVARLLLDHGADRNLQPRHNLGEGYRKVVDMCGS